LINNKTKKIIMTSILRDISVNIPGEQDNLINAAYAYGGPNLLIQTMENNQGCTDVIRSWIEYSRVIDRNQTIGADSEYDCVFIRDGQYDQNQVEIKQLHCHRL
jgi:hypothetical protein